MKMPFGHALRIIRKGREKEAEDRLWMQYTSIYPYMNEENFISFDDFKNSCFKPEEKKLPVEEIMSNVEDIIGLTL